jgi:probable HAF family extracellular repeat protein
MAAAAIAMIICGGRFEAAHEEPGEVRYHVRPLPELDGGSSRGNGINDAGMVTGFSNLPSGEGRRAIVWTNKRMLRLDPIGGTNSSIAWSGHNNANIVVGITQTGDLQTRSDGWSCRAFFPIDASKYTCVGFVWAGGHMRALPTLGGDNGFAASANSRRQVVGWAETASADSSCKNPADSGFQAVLWDLGRRKTLVLRPYGDDSASAATAISNHGHVVGISGLCDQSVGRHSARHAVMWHNGTVKDLGNIGNDHWNTPTAITRSGDIVVGFASQAGASADDAVFGAWLWTERNDIRCTKLTGGNICDLGTLDPGGTAEAWGVNDRGQVVGTACSPTGYCRAFLWENGEMKDLDLLKAAAYPHRLYNAMDINNRGQISGRARTASGTFEAFVATPRVIRVAGK